MSTRTVGIIMNGVTGRMGTNQHLLRSIVPIIRQGGVRAGDDVILPEPLLVGRNKEKLESVAKAAGIDRWTTDLDAALSDPRMSVYFDAQTTLQRAAGVTRAVKAGKHVYCEKPTATSTDEALELYRLANSRGVKNGVVQDKLWLPGLMKLADLKARGFFGRILSVRGEFGYWVFEGDLVPAQRPSWNYRQEEGGGIVVDMLCHWRYVLDNLFGTVKSVSCLAATHIPKRWDERGAAYDCTADDSAYATFQLEGGVVAHFNSSWDVRVRRDDLLTIQVDGTLGSAVAGLRECWVQPYGATPRPVWNPDIPQPIDFFAGWQKVPDQRTYDNAFKVQWELFLRHVARDEPFRWSLLEGARGVQLAEKGLESSRTRAWVDLPELA
ncbi:MAG TPA: Gfo/Idh/MocA family oxidoreductase [Spirochaetia bacterium]|nr:Gfo/Idh/MocA family oxidoreductase [Spirochaetia bacterium]